MPNMEEIWLNICRRIPSNYWGHAFWRDHPRISLVIWLPWERCRIGSRGTCRSLTNIDHWLGKMAYLRTKQMICHWKNINYSYGWIYEWVFQFHFYNNAIFLNFVLGKGKKKWQKLGVKDLTRTDVAPLANGP